MTQGPRSGQTAPVETPGSTTDDQRDGHGPDDSAAAGNQNSAPSLGGLNMGGSASSTPVHPDAPTGSLPPVSGPTDPAAAPVTSADAPSTPASAGSVVRAETPKQSAGSGDSRSRVRGPRRAHLQLRHINPWTVLKFSSVLAVALFFVWLIVIAILYGILDLAGVTGSINDAYSTLQGDGGGGLFDAGTVFGVSAVIGVIYVVLFIAISTVGSLIYNLCADLVGGVEVTLSER